MSSSDSEGGGVRAGMVRPLVVDEGQCHIKTEDGSFCATTVTFSAALI